MSRLTAIVVISAVAALAFAAGWWLNAGDAPDLPDPVMLEAPVPPRTEPTPAPSPATTESPTVPPPTVAPPPPPAGGDDDDGPDDDAGEVDDD